MYICYYYKLAIFFSYFKIIISKGYFKSEARSITTWNNRAIREIPNINSKIVCGAFCETEPTCTSFKLKDSACTLANIERLEEIREGYSREPFYAVDKKWDIACYGGENCCNNENQCGMVSLSRVIYLAFALAIIF